MPKRQAKSGNTVFSDEASTSVSLDTTVNGNIGHEGEPKIEKRGETSSDDIHAANMNPGAEKGAIEAGEIAPTPEPNTVDWSGPNDPENPRNWSKAYKLTNIIVISLSVLYTNLATTMFAPGAVTMKREFGFKSDTVEVLTITMASLGFALGQLFIPPMSEVFGRMPIYRTSSVFYMGFTAGCARSTNVAEFLVFRLLTGLAAASYMSTGGGTVADLLPKEERGVAMAIFTAGPLFGPVLGPIVGGFVVENLGWRWCFYLILILAGVVTTITFLFMHETSSINILKSKAARLRKETGNPNLRAAGDKQTPVKQLVLHALTRPMKFLFTSPIVALISLYIAFNFGVTMLLFATFPTVYENTYHWSISISGLAYIGVGVGCAIGVITFAKLSDRLLNAKEGNYRAERRLIMMMFVSPMFPIGLFIYGWTTEYKVHWVVPIIGTAICGPGAVIINSSSQTYIIDIFGPQAAASALAAITLLRNLTGAFLPLAAPALYANLGLGWGNSVLAFITVGFIPVPICFYLYGASLRKRFPVTI
ncbi:major facilitator superfamily domain protein [Fusarium tjaetaba]|uniref:Major facilitator superfamily domain protein n=1 Tax=Fusarium tjaetaba TaxID=1567544 RepID=A0A8H5SFN5_9HYPO|nr:major facilitator superfamily domain protein [Fusarium tjaetaba]KAF5650114.1 major facilitator superfamily domain protein [Fusarium tjaetaba]